MDSIFFEGTVIVPLCALQGDQTAVSSSYSEFLRDIQSRGLSVNITPKVRDEVFNAVGRTTLGGANTTMLHGYHIPCQVTSSLVQKAIQELGTQHQCTLRLFCVPPDPRSVTDGMAFCSYLHYVKVPWSQGSRAEAAQAWINKLSLCKQHIMGLMIPREPIIKALNDLLIIPGLWEGLQLGNWGKHFAAHMDEFIVQYLKNILRIWKGFMQNHEDKLHFIDSGTVKHLHRHCPGRVPEHRERILQGFQDFSLFPGIKDEATRLSIQQNILAQQSIIPSLTTLDDNMRYLSIGARIIQHYIEVPPKQNRRAKQIEYQSKSLWRSLKRDWKKGKLVIETGKDQFAELNRSGIAELSVLQLFIAALRHFAHLSSEDPLQDFNNRITSIPYGEAHKVYLCHLARRLGFDNEKIKAGCAIPMSSITLPNIAHATRHPRKHWRSGKPPMLSYEILQKSAFLPNLYDIQSKQQSILDPEFVLGNILTLFIGEVPLALLKRVAEAMNKTNRAKSMNPATSVSPANSGAHISNHNTGNITTEKRRLNVTEKRKVQRGSNHETRQRKRIRINSKPSTLPSAPESLTPAPHVHNSHIPLSSALESLTPLPHVPDGQIPLPPAFESLTPAPANLPNTLNVPPLPDTMDLDLNTYEDIGEVLRRPISPINVEEEEIGDRSGAKTVLENNTMVDHQLLSGITFDGPGWNVISRSARDNNIREQAVRQRQGGDPIFDSVPETNPIGSSRLTPPRQEVEEEL